MEQAFPKTITENGMEYIWDENTETYLPNLTLPQTEPLGKYGIALRRYLKEHKRAMYLTKECEGTLWDYLKQTEQEVNERLERIIPEMAKAAGVDEQMKQNSPMKWIKRMNMIKMQAEEIVLKELIYI